MTIPQSIDAFVESTLTLINLSPEACLSKETITHSKRAGKRCRFRTGFAGHNALKASAPVAFPLVDVEPFAAQKICLLGPPSGVAAGPFCIGGKWQIYRIKRFVRSIDETMDMLRAGSSNFPSDSPEKPDLDRT